MLRNKYPSRPLTLGHFTVTPCFIPTLGPNSSQYLMLNSGCAGHQHVHADVLDALLPSVCERIKAMEPEESWYLKKKRVAYKAM